MAAPTLNQELKSFLEMFTTDPNWNGISERLVPANFETDASAEATFFADRRRDVEHKFGKHGLIEFDPREAIQAYRNATKRRDMHGVNTMAAKFDTEYALRFENVDLLDAFNNLPSELHAMGDRLVPSTINNDGTINQIELQKLRTDRIAKYGPGGVVEVISGHLVSADKALMASPPNSGYMNALAAKAQDAYNKIEEKEKADYKKSGWENYLHPNEEKNYKAVKGIKWTGGALSAMFGAVALFDTGIAYQEKSAMFSHEGAMTVLNHTFTAPANSASISLWFLAAGLGVAGWGISKFTRSKLSSRVSNEIMERREKYAPKP